MPLFQSDTANNLINLVLNTRHMNTPAALLLLSRHFKAAREYLLEFNLDGEQHPLLYYLFPIPDGQDHPQILRHKTLLLLALSRTGINPLVAMLRFGALRHFAFALHLLRNHHPLHAQDLHTILCQADLDGVTPVEAALRVGNSVLLTDLFQTQSVILSKESCLAIVFQRLQNQRSLYRVLEDHPNIYLLLIYADFLIRTFGMDTMREIICAQAQAPDLRWQLEYYISWRRALVLLDCVERLDKSSEPTICLNYTLASRYHQKPFRLGLFDNDIPCITPGTNVITSEEEKGYHYHLPSGLLDDVEAPRQPQRFC